ncbi:hypothetical protein EON62_00550, partial [archaeon]
MSCLLACFLCATFASLATASTHTDVQYWMETVAGGGWGTGESALNASVSIAWAAVPNVTDSATYGMYIVEAGLHRVMYVDADGVLSIVAGMRVYGFSGDGGLAVHARLYTPRDVLPFPDDRSILIADFNNGRIRKVDADGIISTFAGNGLGVSSGDGGHVRDAGFAAPIALVRDATRSQRWFIADFNAHVVRVVDANNIIWTIAGGNDLSLHPGVPIDGVLANATWLYRPSDVCVAPNGELHIADQYHHVVRAINSSGYIHTVAGVGANPGFDGDGLVATASRLYYPTSVAFDASGVMYISDQSNRRVRRVNASGYMDTFMGNGSLDVNPSSVPVSAPAADYPVVYPLMIRFAASGSHMLLADSSVRNVIDVDMSTEIATRRVGDPASTYSLLDNFRSVRSWNESEGSLLVTRQQQHRVSRLEADGRMVDVAGVGIPGFAGDGGAALSALFWGPSDADMLPSSPGAFLVADMNNHRIRLVGSDGVISTVAGNGSSTWCSGSGVLAILACTPFPRGVVARSDGSWFAILDNGVVFVNAGGVMTVLMSKNPGEGALHLFTPYDVGRSVQVVSFPGNTEQTLVIALTSAHCVVTVSWTSPPTAYAGICSSTYGFNGDGQPATSALLTSPWGAYWDGPTRVMWIADTGNHRVRTVNSSGTIDTRVGTGVPGLGGDGDIAIRAQLHNPRSVLVRAGVVYIVDSNIGRIRVVSVSGIVSTISLVVMGDGGPPLGAHFVRPTATADDGRGGMLIADDMGNAVRRLQLAADGTPFVTTVAGDVAGYSWGGNASVVIAGRVGCPTDATLYINGSAAFTDACMHGVAVVPLSSEVAREQGTAALVGAPNTTLASLAWAPASGVLYLADTQLQAVWRLANDTTPARIVAGNSSAAFTMLPTLGNATN